MVPRELLSKAPAEHRAWLSMVVVLLLAVLPVAGGCEGSPVGEPDLGVADETGSDIGGDDGPVAEPPPVPPELPAPARPPVLEDWICPAGWLPREVLAETPQAHRICEPPEPPRDCPSGSMPVVGQSDCQPIGPGCPETGDFATDLPAGATVLYVKPGSAGTGTLADPFGTIAEAVAAAPAGAVVALARGSYREDVVLSREITLWGACTSDQGTVLEGDPAPAEDGPGTIEVEASGRPATVRNLVLRAGRRAVHVAVGAAVVLQELQVEDVAGRAIYLEDESTASISDTLVRNTRPFASDEGAAIVAFDGSTVTLERVSIEEGTFVGLYIGATLDPPVAPVVTVSDLLVRDTRQLNGIAGIGAQFDGSQVTLQRVLVTGNTALGLSACSSTEGKASLLTSIEASSVVVRNTGAQTDGEGGTGVGIFCGSEARLQQVVSEGNVTNGVQADGKAELVGVYLARNLEAGIAVTSGTLEASRVVLEANRGFALAIRSMGEQAPSMQVEDAVIIDTVPRKDGSRGEALYAYAGTSVTLRRSLVARHATAGILAETGVRVLLEDVQVSDVVPHVVNENAGYGVVVAADETVVRRLRVERAQAAGLLIFGEVQADLQDVIIEAIPGYSDGTVGDGLAIIDATVTAARVQAANVHRAAISVFGGQLDIAELTLECNGIHLNGEAYQDPGNGFTITPSGASRCGCMETAEVCATLSSMLIPPEPPSVESP